ncbi:hypothetical protein ACTWPB_27075 [Nocardia sp. IBHARD005]|uniref:hypothetical protein n=1 Tax=Nocardia sp. IBHARD005 TaxID=3457765 RepID=UPI004058FAC6
MLWIRSPQHLASHHHPTSPPSPPDQLTHLDDYVRAALDHRTAALDSALDSGMRLIPAWPAPP